MSEPAALQARRSLLFERIAAMSDEIGRIDRRLVWLKAGKPGADSDLPGNLR